MYTVKVNLKKRNYSIIIGKGIIKYLGSHLKKLNLGSHAYIITNRPIQKMYGGLLNKILKKSGIAAQIKLVPDTEKSKSLEMVFEITKEMSRFHKKKRVFIIAFGGGVIGDLSGFIASIYKRGIAYIQVPTTLLAQVDSSIGGKTAVDLSEGKNLIGSFYQPRLVFTDLAFLESLDSRQIRSALAEVIKYGIIKDRKLFDYLEKNYQDILSLKPSALEFIVRRCCEIKAKIVQADEREERGLRTILNFGHTLGHAIETAGNYNRYNHGEAVGLGMLLACDISQEMNMANQGVVGKIERLIKNVGLPAQIKGISKDAIIEAHYADKKFTGGQNKFVLIKDITKIEIVKGIPLKVINKALQKRMA